MVDIAICEDNIYDIKILEEHIKIFFSCGKNIKYKIHKFSAGHELIAEIERDNNCFNIIFMDIILESENGIDIIKKINELNPKITIIYQSVNPDFHKHLYSTDHLYFLEKPISYEDFTPAIEKALKYLEPQYIIINLSNGSVLRILCNDIIYAESFRHEIIIHKTDGEKIVVKNTLKNLLEILPTHFIKCHKSFIVNLKKVKEYKYKKSFTLENDTVINIGRSYSEETDLLMIKYWRK